MKRIYYFLFFLLFLTGCSKELVRYKGSDYRVIEAGSQLWMAENLKADNYRFGRKIQLINSSYTWPDLTKGACGYMDADTSKLNKYGMYYNWLAVSGGKLCPLSWRVPTNKDWTDLEEFLGGGMRAGGKMKSVTGWKGKHVSGDDIGFNALPGGYRLNGDFQEGESTVWWSSSIAVMNDIENKKTGESFETNDPMMKWIWGRRLEMGSSELMITINRPNNGFYVRCVKDNRKKR